MKKDFNLKIGEKKIFDNYSLKFQKLDLKEFKNYKAVIGEFNVKNLEKNLDLFFIPKLEFMKNQTR